MSMFDEYVEKLKKQKIDHSGDDEASSGVSVDFEGMDIDHDSIKTLQGQIQDSKKTIEANTEQITQLQAGMEKAKSENRFQDAATAQNGMQLLLDANKNLEQSIIDTESLIEEKEAHNAEIALKYWETRLQNAPELMSRQQAEVVLRINRADRIMKVENQYAVHLDRALKVVQICIDDAIKNYNNQVSVSIGYQDTPLKEAVSLPANLIDSIQKVQTYTYTADIYYIKFHETYGCGSNPGALEVTFTNSAGHIGKAIHLGHTTQYRYDSEKNQQYRIKSTETMVLQNAKSTSTSLALYNYCVSKDLSNSYALRVTNECCKHLPKVVVESYLFAITKLIPLLEARLFQQGYSVTFSQTTAQLPYEYTADAYGHDESIIHEKVFKESPPRTYLKSLKEKVQTPSVLLPASLKIDLLQRKSMSDEQIQDHLYPRISFK